jgi:hypothetical protein
VVACAQFCESLDAASLALRCLLGNYAGVSRSVPSFPVTILPGSFVGDKTGACFLVTWREPESGGLCAVLRVARRCKSGVAGKILTVECASAGSRTRSDFVYLPLDTGTHDALVTKLLTAYGGRAGERLNCVS